MSVSTKTARWPGNGFSNVPNQLSALTIALLGGAVRADRLRLPILASMLVFAVAAGTDWLDGYWAHKYGQVTNLGRILDPFVEPKIIICRTFIFLVAAVAGFGRAEPGWRY